MDDEYNALVDIAVRKLMRLKKPVFVYGMDSITRRVLLELKDILVLVIDKEMKPIVEAQFRQFGLKNKVIDIDELEWDDPINKKHVRGNW